MKKIIDEELNNNIVSLLEEYDCTVAGIRYEIPTGGLNAGRIVINIVNISNSHE